MANPIRHWKALEKSDRYTLLSGFIIPFVLWWIYVGRHKYGTKGMK